MGFVEDFCFDGFEEKGVGDQSAAHANDYPNKMGNGK